MLLLCFENPQSFYNGLNFRTQIPIALKCKIGANYYSRIFPNPNPSPNQIDLKTSDQGCGARELWSCCTLLIQCGIICSCRASGMLPSCGSQPRPRTRLTPKLAGVGWISWACKNRGWPTPVDRTPLYQSLLTTTHDLSTPSFETFVMTIQRR